MSEESCLKSNPQTSDLLMSLRTEYSSLLAEVKELEEVYYLMKLEISSLLCEKDFLITSLDDIDMLILKRQQETETKKLPVSLKRPLRSTIEKDLKKISTIKSKEELHIPEKAIAVVDSSDESKIRSAIPIKQELPTNVEESMPKQPAHYPDNNNHSYPQNMYQPVPTTIPNPNLCYSYMPQSFSQVQPTSQYMQMIQNYSNVSPTLNSSPYQLVSPQPNFFFMNPSGVSSVPNSVPGVVNPSADHFVHLPMNSSNSQYISHLTPTSNQ